jgi:hypothetical protein
MALDAVREPGERPLQIVTGHDVGQREADRRQLAGVLLVVV